MRYGSQRGPGNWSLYISQAPPYGLNSRCDLVSSKQMFLLEIRKPRWDGNHYVCSLWPRLWSIWFFWRANRACSSGMWGSVLPVGSVALELTSRRRHRDFPMSVLSAGLGDLLDSQFRAGGARVTPGSQTKGCSVSSPNHLVRKRKQALWMAKS